MVDPHRTFEVASAAGVTGVESLGHLLDFLIRQPGIAQDAPPQNAGYGEMAAVYRQQQLGAMARNVARVAGRQINMTFGGAAGTFGADPDVMIEGQSVIGVFEDGRESFQKPLRTVAYIEVFDVVTDWQALSANYLRLLGGSESFAAFFGG
jgi:hypothetical protein